MAGRFTGEVAGAAVTDAESAIEELRGLADADAAAFGELLAAWRLPEDQPDRPDRVTAAALGACDVPLRICQLGAVIAQHGLWLATEGKRDLRGDAFTGALLAHAAVQAAARLVEINAVQADNRGPADEAMVLATSIRQLVDKAAHELP